MGEISKESSLGSYGWDATGKSAVRIS